MDLLSLSNVQELMNQAEVATSVWDTDDFNNSEDACVACETPVVQYSYHQMFQMLDTNVTIYDKVTKINNNHNKNHMQKLPEAGLPRGPCIIK